MKTRQHPRDAKGTPYKVIIGVDGKPLLDRNGHPYYDTGDFGDGVDRHSKDFYEKLLADRKKRSERTAE